MPTGGAGQTAFRIQAGIVVLAITPEARSLANIHRLGRFDDGDVTSAI